MYLTPLKQFYFHLLFRFSTSAVPLSPQCHEQPHWKQIKTFRKTRSDVKISDLHDICELCEDPLHCRFIRPLGVFT